jgi:hypothetical protein
MIFNLLTYCPPGRERSQKAPELGKGRRTVLNVGGWRGEVTAWCLREMGRN